MTSQRISRAGSGSGYPGTSEWEFKVLSLPRGVSRSEVRQLLTDHAEYGRWELHSVQLFMGGTRRVELRRKVMRVERTA